MENNLGNVLHRNRKLLCKSHLAQEEVTNNLLYDDFYVNINNVDCINPDPMSYLT